MDQQTPQTSTEMEPVQAETATAKVQQTATGVTKPSREKDAKKVETGCKGAGARKAKQEQLLAELKQAKTSINPAATHVNDTQAVESPDRKPSLLSFQRNWNGNRNSKTGPLI